MSKNKMKKKHIKTHDPDQFRPGQLQAHDGGASRQRLRYTDGHGIVPDGKRPVRTAGQADGGQPEAYGRKNERSMMHPVHIY